MARSFRFLVKKRRNRQTGSPQLAALSQSVLFGSLFVVGVVFLIAVIIFQFLPEWQVIRSYERTTCVVLDKRLDPDPADSARNRPAIQIEYDVDKKPYKIWTYDARYHHGRGFDSGTESQQQVLDEFIIGRSYACWYDPLHPDQAVLIYGFHWYTWVLLLLPLPFIVIGGSGAGYIGITWGKSAERRAVLVQRASHLELFEPSDDYKDDDYPAVPKATDLTNSPGVRLKYRLPIERSPMWRMITAGTVFLVVMTITVLFVNMAVQTLVTKNPDWLLTVFAGSWLIVSAATLVYFLRQVVANTRAGMTIVEIESHPLYPGEQYDLFISQTGRLRLRWIEMSLCCEEIATFRQGTNTRTTRKRVYWEKLLRQEDVQVRQNVPLEAELKLSIPAEAMHSFKTMHNEVHWQLVVHGKPQGMPAFKRQFPVHIYPAPRERVVQ